MGKVSNLASVIVNSTGLREGDNGFTKPRTLSQFLWGQSAQKRAGGPRSHSRTPQSQTRLFIYFDRWNLVLMKRYFMRYFQREKRS